MCHSELLYAKEMIVIVLASCHISGFCNKILSPLLTCLTLFWEYLNITRDSQYFEVFVAHNTALSNSLTILYMKLLCAVLFLCTCKPD